MFERLINCGIPHVTLNTQWRAHPDLASLITPSIYRNLLNSSTVGTHPPVRGLQSRIFFINHQHLEDSEQQAKVEAADQGGRSNTYEAKMVLGLAQYLLLNGYSPKQVVILSMYKQQLRLLRSLAKEISGGTLINNSVSEIVVKTTDNFQGEECDVVLLSLVRSNKEEKAGFVKIANRVCVALSRARNGLYVFGNFNMIRKSSDLWEEICSGIETKEQMGPALCLQCQNHPESVVSVSSPEQFSCAPNGGCMLRCRGRFPLCGHKCAQLCHPMSHDQIICNSVCEKPREPSCVHPCPEVCGRECPPCRVLMPKIRTSCGHTLNVKCSDEVEDVRCSRPCPVSMICGHACAEECSHNHPSGYKCRKGCTRSRLTCSHPCPKKCYENCGDCMVIVSKPLPCGHTVSVPCHTDMTSYLCKEKCKRILAGCDHMCPKQCFELCPTVCMEEVKKPQPCCQNPVPHILKGLCGVELPRVSCVDKCRVPLPFCSHLCEGKCGVCLPVGCIPSAVVHGPCKKICEKILPCNHKCSSEHLCGTTCPPCTKPCVMMCAHRKCTQECGAPCIPCTEACNEACPHIGAKTHACCEGGFQPGTDALVCGEPCTKPLKCGHACLGLCGEVCPPICLLCTTGKVKVTYKKLANQRPITKELLHQARFIVLNCNHCFEVKILDDYMRQQATMDYYPRCPECRVTVQGVHRYGGLVHARVEVLRPPYFQLREVQLRSDFEKDLRLQNYGVIIETSRRQLQNSGRSTLEVQMENPLLQYFLGRALHLTGQYKEAAAVLLNVLATAANKTLLAEASNALGIIYRDNSKHITKAIEFFEKSLSFDDSQSETKANLSEARRMYQREQEELERKAVQAASRLRAERTKAEAVAASTTRLEGSEEFESQAELQRASDKERAAQEAEDAEELARSGGTRLHLAVLRNRPKDVTDLLGNDKTLASLQDNFKKTRKLVWTKIMRIAVLCFLKYNFNVMLCVFIVQHYTGPPSCETIPLFNS